MIDRWMKRIADRARLALTSDRTFLENAYRQILGRDIDQDGFDYYAARLREGESRMAVLIDLAQSNEFLEKVSARAESRTETDIRALRPSSYQLDVDTVSKTSVPVYVVNQASDFDWLESMILEHGYYEQPGVWNFDIDVDKRVMAEMIGAFSPQRAIELGCAGGAVLQCLDELGILCEGVEISRMAIERAASYIRRRIHQGELPQLQLGTHYDLVFGLDIFEHLNPNRLGAYLDEITNVLKDGGYLFANIPAFGADPVFGTVFPFYLEGWDEDAAAERLFSKIHVDPNGYPLHGHLIWAGSSWWVRRFTNQGLEREIDIEKALHRKYDAYLDRRARARKSFYIFSKKGLPERRKAVVQRIASNPSRVLKL
jgi:SAM-dependent methyltransferase